MAENAASTRSHYHHGNLNEALVDAAITLIEKHGVEKLSVREVAKLAGVSPGAPFRHFSNKKALLTAVAEQALERLTLSVRTELALCDPANPVAGLHAIGKGYLNCAYNNPTHFQIVSSRSLIDFQSSAKLVDGNGALRTLMVDLIERAQAEGRADPDVPVENIIFSSRAFVYGVARMWIDGHFYEWGISKPPLQAMHDALDMFISSLEIK